MSEEHRAAPPKGLDLASKRPSYMSWLHWGVRDRSAFQTHLAGLVDSLGVGGIFASDNVVAFGRNLGFLDDERLLTAWETHATQPRERSILWRTANIQWAVQQAARLDGDFVECGVYEGTTARIILDLVDLGRRRFWLYDLFRVEEGRHALTGMGEALEQRVRERFAAFPNVEVIQGSVPESFAKGAPDRVAFAHIDMNHVAPELGALDVLEERFTPGAVIVLDDYGWLPHRQQFFAEKEWFARRGRPVMEIPTGQGLVIW